VPGAIPGAIPPVIGWVAGGGHLTEAGAVILFGILFLWQMPHFWALALRYRADYAAGGFPMVSERVGVEGTARLIQLYALGLTAWSLAAPTFGVGGPAALVAAREALALESAGERDPLHGEVQSVTPIEASPDPERQMTLFEHEA